MTMIRLSRFKTRADEYREFSRPRQWNLLGLERVFQIDSCLIKAIVILFKMKKKKTAES